MLKKSTNQIMRMSSKTNTKMSGSMKKANKIPKETKNKAQCKPSSNPYDNKINKKPKFI